MEFPPPLRGFAASLDPHGVVRHYLFDGLGARRHLGPGAPLMALCEIGSRGDCRRFVDELLATGRAAGWQLTVILHGHHARLHFAGEHIEGETVVVAARTLEDADALIQHVVRDSALRAAVA